MVTVVKPAQSDEQNETKKKGIPRQK